MKKHLVLLIILTCVYGSTYAQGDEIPYTIKELDGKFKEQHHSILAYDENGFYVLKTKSQGAAVTGIPIGIKAEIYIDYINKDLEVEKTLFLEDYHWEILNNPKNSVEFFHFNTEKNILSMGYSTYDDKTTKLFIGDVDLATGEVLNKRLIFSDNEVDRRGTFSLVESITNNIFGLYSIVPSKEEKFESKLFTAAFDTNFELIKQNQVILPLKTKSSTSNLNSLSGFSTLRKQTVLVDEDGNMSFVIKVDEYKIINLGMTDYNYFLIKVSEKPGNFHSTTLGRDETYFLKEVTINQNEDGDLVCLASYSEEKSVHQVITGLIVYTFDSNNLEIINDSKMQFSEAQLSELQPSKGQIIEKLIDGYLKKSLKSNAVFLDLNFSRINPDGSITLFTELYHSYYVTGSKYKIARYVEFGGNIFEMNISDGRLNTITTINRDFYGDLVAAPGSYLHGILDGEDILMFVDTDSFNLNFAVRNEFGEYKEFYIPNIRKNKDFKNKRMSFRSFNLEDDKYQYLFLRKKSKFYIVKLDLSNL